MYFVRRGAAAAAAFPVLLALLYTVNQECPRALIAELFKDWERVTGRASTDKLYSEPLYVRALHHKKLQYPLGRKTCT